MRRKAKASPVIAPPGHSVRQVLDYNRNPIAASPFLTRNAPAFMTIDPGGGLAYVANIDARNLAGDRRR
jgi:hypothetical protein